jgi:hypothetical protein
MRSWAASIASTFAVIAIGGDVALAAQPSPMIARPVARAAAPSLNSSGVRSARECVADDSAPVVFYGRVPAVEMISAQPSYVQILPQSDATTLYFSVLESNVTGTSWLPPDAYSDPNFLQKEGVMMGQLRAAMQISVNARILHTGEFVCRGFAAGKYSFLATVHALGRREGAPQSSLETYVYRSDVTVPPTSKGRVVVTVPAFRLVGHN